MPAMPLNAEQKEDAKRLRLQFERWQDKMREESKPATQEEAASHLPFGQSALAQYIGGRIPLNISALIEFCDLFACAPADVSPNLSEQIRMLLERVAPHLRAPHRLKAVESSGWPFEITKFEDFDSLGPMEKVMVDSALAGLIAPLHAARTGNRAQR